MAVGVIVGVVLALPPLLQACKTGKSSALGTYEATETMVSPEFKPITNIGVTEIDCYAIFRVWSNWQLISSQLEPPADDFSTGPLILNSNAK